MMASSRMAALWVALALAMAMACYVQGVVGQNFEVRDISGKIGNGTVQLQLDSPESGAYLTATSADQLGQTKDAKDPNSFWYITTELDRSVFIRNQHFERYITLDVELFGPDKVKLQQDRDLFLGRWWFVEEGDSGWYHLRNTFNILYYISFNNNNNEAGSTAFRILPLDPRPPRPPTKAAAAWK